MLNIYINEHILHVFQLLYNVHYYKEEKQKR